MQEQPINKIVNEVTRRVLRTLVLSETDPETMRPYDAEKKFGIPEATIRHLVRTGRVKGKTGKPFLVNVKSLREFIGE